MFVPMFPAGACPLKSGTLAVRARVKGRPEAPWDRLNDSITADLLARGPLSRVRFARTWTSDDDLRALAALKRAPLDPALARALSAMHVRLGASAASLANLERLARGEAVATVAGHSPRRSAARSIRSTRSPPPRDSRAP